MYPVSLPDASKLATDDPYQFQWWALGLVGAAVEQKKGAVKGIDGRIDFHEGPGKTKQIILSVKAGRGTDRPDAAGSGLSGFLHVPVG